MTISQRLDLRQSQTLVMTPQLQQAIKLLQMSNQELGEFVATEVEKNPLLEAIDESFGFGERSGTLGEPQENFAGPLEPSAAFDEALPPLSGHDLETTDGALALGPDGPETGESWGGEGQGGDAGREDAFMPLRAGYASVPDDFALAENVAERPSLREHLAGQIQVDLAEPADRMIAAALVELLDEAGYLPADLDLVRAQLGATPARFAQIIARLQRFEPAGMFARSLKECLALQLRDRNRLDPAMETLLDHLDLVARRERAALMKLCGVDAEDLTEMIAEIRTLNPKPAQVFAADVAPPIVPDVILKAVPGHGWHVELNADTLPRVLANDRYYARVQASPLAKPEKEYVSDRWQQANWLVKALQQRATTILKVATEIVRQQDAFFVHGVQHLKPLILRDIAAAVEMHESTVSRVTQNKFIATPRGLFELKYFFTTALAKTDGLSEGDAVSSEAARDRIRRLIDAEEPARILSDDRIADILRADGIDIARRTVAKYREAMKIPSSARRRREKRDR